nr:MAG TPA: hypothetical protein [Caudoviricetes sp.]
MYIYLLPKKAIKTFKKQVVITKKPEKGRKMKCTKNRF